MPSEPDAEALEKLREAVALASRRDRGEAVRAVLKVLGERASEQLPGMGATARDIIGKALTEFDPDAEPDSILGPIGTALDADLLREFFDWTKAPLTREWICQDWLPAGRVTLFTGPGAAGKSRLALQLAVAIASGKPPRHAADRKSGFAFLPGAGERDGKQWAFAPSVVLPSPAHVFLATWEDEKEEISRRIRQIGAKPEDLRNRLRVFDLAGRGPLWGPDPGKSTHRDAASVPHELGKALLRRADDLKPKLIVVDPLAAAFAGNENDRAAVRAFLSWLGDAAAETGVAILLVAHPPKSPEHRFSGSTDWRNGCRALWSLEAKPAPGWTYSDDDNQAVAALGYRLLLDKSSYGPDGDAAWLRMEVGRGGRVLWEETTPEAAARSYQRRRGGNHKGVHKKKNKKKDEPPEQEQEVCPGCERTEGHAEGCPEAEKLIRA